jgi:hypothetical protein
MNLRKNTNSLAFSGMDFPIREFVVGAQICYIQPDTIAIPSSLIPAQTHYTSFLRIMLSGAHSAFRI